MNSLVKIENLKKYYRIDKGLLKKKSYYVKAVDGISLSINKGETVGLVGESGSGKSTVARLLLNFTTPTENTIYFDDIDIFKANKSEKKSIRKKIGIIFQDPAASLNPRSTVYESLKRPLEINGTAKKDIHSYIMNTLELVNLGEELLYRYPHQLSGGQQQRVCIARAIILNPEFLVLDEPTSALDVSVQAQILNLLLEIQAEKGLTYLFISHNLSVVRYISDKIGVMYLGQLMELGKVEQIYKNAMHPYTIGLLTSEPIYSPKDRGRKKLILEGEPPSLMNPPVGCRLATRCPFSKDICNHENPAFREIEPEHFVACHFAEVLDYSMYVDRQ
ncbi:MAG: ATP-binding cassette domain-containing protein [Gudongella sp.]|nr:ATP-binding cassette domain-containing protein [Gudongella sp.]